MTRQRAEAVFVMDRHISRLVHTLKKTKEWPDTVFLFTSDNGSFLGEHRRRSGKVLGREPSARVPLLVTGPGMRGRDSHGHHRFDPITTVDLTATILDLAGARPPLRPADGRSRLPTLLEGDRGWKAGVLHESGWHGRTRVNGFRAGCRVELPALLAAGPARNRRLTRGYWRDIDRVYGW